MTKRELFNNVHFQSPPDDSVFLKFPYLPDELRLVIWSHSLRRRRWIPLRVVLPDNFHLFSALGNSPMGKHLRTPYYSSRNSLGKIISGWNYHLSIDDDDDSTLSPLLRVNMEARQVALDFYRVRVPVCRRLSPASGRGLYLNPEYDVVFLKWCAEPYLMADILHDIKAHDPRDVGVVHLALDEWHYDVFEELSCEGPESPTTSPFPRDTIHGLTLSILHPVARASLAEVIRSNIRTIFYIVDFDYGRVWHPRRWPISLHDGSHVDGPIVLHHARGRPLERYLNSVSFFDWLPRDPRPVEADLGMVQLRDNPRKFSEGWRPLEAVFGIEDWWQKHPRPDFYVCPTTQWQGTLRYYHQWPEESRPEDGFARQRLERYLDREQIWYDEACQDAACLQWEGGKCGSVLDQATYERLQVELRDVVGMWVLRPDEYVDHENRTDPAERWRRCYDVSAAWPGLVVFENPVT
ncbi:hypothetical protein PspLS_07073 [Pyricularia sp. CBS 133598]|nr:hypothetical protein PspLS_07073 [Pyricularia sp. CBS 133598]